jgi:hypothetical protein
MKKQVVFWSGILGVLLFALPSVLGGLQIEGYSVISQYISESFATGVPKTAYLRFMFVIGGVLLFIFGLTVPLVLPRSRTLKIGFLLFALFYGLGTITVALFPCDFGCPTDVENSSLSQLIHNASGFLTYVITPFAMMGVGVTLQKWAYARPLSKVSLICGGLAFVFVFILFADPTGPYIGLFQRIVECSILFWIAYTAIYGRTIEDQSMK